MATQSPFSRLGDLIAQAGADLQPPDWLQEEVRNRIVLLLNHVLKQESEATARLARQKGRVLWFHWRQLHFKLAVTPAGLLEVAPAQAEPSLTLSVTDDSALGVVQSVLRGERPAVRIEGDVQLAAEVNWVVDHVRWDVEDDLARILGDVPARTLMQGVRAALDALRRWRGPAAGGQA